MYNCPVCQEKLLVPLLGLSTGSDRAVPADCPRCGKYYITDAVQSVLYNLLSPRQVANASGWLRENQGVTVTQDVIEKFKIISTPNYGEKKRKLLTFMQQRTPRLGAYLALNSQTAMEMIAATWCIDANELGFLLEGLEIDALAQKRTGQEYRLTPKGYDFIAQISANPESQIGFCAMWFDESVNHLYDNAIEPAITAAGYQPLRIDKKEHVNRIDDEIFADIRRSRFVVADFTHGSTGVRGGVYFEAGFAQGLGLPVIWTCREDMLTPEKLHFDIRQYNFLGWKEDNLDDFRDRLQKRIEAILGRGSWKPDTQ